MIVVDTSALMAILRDEPMKVPCLEALQYEPDVYVSAGTLIEATIVSHGKQLGAEMTALLEEVRPIVMDVTEETVLIAREGYLQWGKGVHPAGLNFGDCFSYALAKQLDCPLLYIGNDFGQTDIRSAI
ncbi:twitching motility protein PilT [Devosia insulae DS-56]|uniref:Twitching motility protein PilT n=1 Tax=Devosia insulae DS-56 TaxID=1116389 RepID=A0A1E5XNC6_9HYPH|nr:type II toxin-antitoxin system VapC family toxin [Devosia insulae]OEO30116.1 twitching motility protein PilT [Devosia insulae DS-56]